MRRVLTPDRAKLDKTSRGQRPPAGTIRHPPVQLDYAHRCSSYRTSATWQRLRTATCILGASWLIWAVIGFATFDPIEFDQDSYLTFMVALPGTVCGLIACMVVLLVIPEQRRHRRSS